MKQPLKENGGLPASILWTLAIVAGISVANIYYVQPLLNMIRHELGISEFRTNLIAMVTQIGYAAGLLFITPLGDLYQRKKIILANFLVLIFSLLTIALAHNIHVILVASFLTGACSMIPQIFIPMAAQFSRPEHKGRNVGIVLSGLLTGILASRVVSGFVGELFGWREMYYIAAGMMFVCAVVVLKVLPNIQTNFRGKYSDLMKSLLALVKEFPQLGIYSIRAALNFGSLLAMWSCLAFKMGQAPFFANRRDWYAGTLRSSRSINSFFCGKICKTGRRPPLQLHRLRVDSFVLVIVLRRRKHLRRNHRRHYHD